MSNLATLGLDLTQSNVFLDERGLRQNNQSKAGFIGSHHSHSHHRAAPEMRPKPKVMSPFLTPEERHHEMQKRGILPEGTTLAAQPSTDCFRCAAYLPKEQKVEEVVDKNAKSVEMIAAEQEHGIQFTTNHEMIAMQTREQGSGIRSLKQPELAFELTTNHEMISHQTREQATASGVMKISRDADGFATQTMDAMPTQTMQTFFASPPPIDKFNQVTAFVPAKRPEQVADMSHLPGRQLKSVSEWKKYLFDQMTNSEVDLTDKHMKEIQKDVHDQLKEVYLAKEKAKKAGLQSPLANEKYADNVRQLLDLHQNFFPEFFKAPTGPIRKVDETQIPQQKGIKAVKNRFFELFRPKKQNIELVIPVIPTNAEKISKGADVVRAFRTGVKEVLALSRK